MKAQTSIARFTISKRLFTLFAAFALAFSMVPIAAGQSVQTAYADLNATFTVTAPVEGDDTTTPPVVTVPSDVDYHVGYAQWVADGSGVSLSEPVTFEEGETYYIRVLLLPNEAFAFDTSMTLTPVGCSIISVVNTGRYIEAIVSVKAVEAPVTPVAEAHIDLTPPIANGKNDTWHDDPNGHVSIPSDATYSIASVHDRWLQADGTPTGQPGYEYSYIFVENTVYAVRVTLQGTDRNPFDANTKVTTTESNGASVRSTAYDAENNTITVILNIAATVSAPRIPIESVSLTVNAPAAGTTVGAASNKEDGIVVLESDVPYEFSTSPLDGKEFEWQPKDGSHYLADDVQFVAGETYLLYIGLQTKDFSHIFADPTAFTVTSEDAVLDHATGPGSSGEHSTYTLAVYVTIPGAYNVTTANCKATVDGAEVTAAEPGATVTFTAVPPTSQYPDAASISLMQWNIDGTVIASTAETQTLTMPSHNVTVIACYQVWSDSTTDDSTATVSSVLYVTDAALSVGIYAGSVYSKTEGVAYSATAADEPIASMLAAANTALNTKITALVNGYSYTVTEQTNTTTENRVWDNRAYSMKYLDAGGAEIEADSLPGNAAIELHSATGSYGKDTTYETTTSVEYLSTSVLGVSRSEGGTVKVETTRNDETEVRSTDAHPANINVVNGSSVKLTATPAKGYYFVGWYEGVYGDSGFVENYDPNVTWTTTGPLTIPVFVEGETVYALFEPTVTVTLIGSPIDGTKPFEDYVIEIPQGTSLVDIDDDAWDAIIEHFTNDAYAPYNNDLYALEKPLSQYSDWRTVSEDDLYDVDLETETTFYIPLVKSIDKVEITVNPPVVGDTVEITDGPHGPTSQTNPPEVSAPSGAAYSITDNMPLFWIDPEEGSPFEGTFEADTDYGILCGLEPSFGYGFARTVECTVNGGELDRVMSYGREGCLVIAKVRAVVPATITYDLAGGTLDGKTGTSTVDSYVGATITLPAPTREGYEFDYWEGSRYEAGASYTVPEGGHTFTAVWKAPASGGSSDSTPASGIAQTGDATPLGLLAVSGALAAAALAFATRRRFG